jgi:hypothetical protein
MLVMDPAGYEMRLLPLLVVVVGVPGMVGAAPVVLEAARLVLEVLLPVLVAVLLVVGVAGVAPVVGGAVVSLLVLVAAGMLAL